MEGRRVSRKPCLFVLETETPTLNSVLYTFAVLFSSWAPSVRAVKPVPTSYRCLPPHTHIL